MSLTFDMLDKANRREMHRAEADKLRAALAPATGVVRSTMWERFGREIAIIVFACIAFVGFLAWLWVETA